jgi:hypothetical protein
MAGFIPAINRRIRWQPRDTLRRSQIGVPDPINALLDSNLGMHAVAQVTKERTDPPAPTHWVPQPPFRRDAGRHGRRSSRSFLARFARFAPRKSSSASHLPGTAVWVVIVLFNDAPMTLYRIWITRAAGSAPKTACQQSPTLFGRMIARSQNANDSSAVPNFYGRIDTLLVQH